MQVGLHQNAIKLSLSPLHAGPDERGQGARVHVLSQLPWAIASFFSFILQFPWMVGIETKALFFFVFPFRSFRERFGLVRRMTRTFSPIFGLNSISLNLKPEPRNRRVDEIKRKNIESGIRFI